MDTAPTTKTGCCAKDAEGKRCNRTPHQWRQLLTFYSIFYTCLVAFFAICYSVMYETLPDRQSGPVYQGLINNRLVMYPNEPDWNINDPAAVNGLVASINDMLARSNQTGASFGACTPPNYGLDSTSPCFLLRMNRKIGFQIPNDAVITCVGGDRANEAGSLTFTVFNSPFPASSFPFMNGGSGQPTNPYIDPIAAVQISGLNAEADFEINCQANWGQDLGDGDDGYGVFRIKYFSTPI